jgi:hypothetical protein
MAKLLMVLFLTASVYAATQALATKPRNIGEANELSEEYEEKILRHPFLNEVLADLEGTTANIEKYNPLILRHVENSLQNLAKRVKGKRMLICSITPQPYCDLSSQ